MLRMKSLLIAAVLCGITVLFAQSGASKPAKTEDADELALRQIVADNTAAFNRRDPVALAAHLAGDADHINVVGEWTRSKDEFQRGLEKYFSSPRPTTSDSVEKVRFLSPDAAVAIVRRQYRSDAGVRTSIATYVFQKIAGEWKIVTFQNTFEQPRP
jgi:uncharacterized protein (TIGR02246 family)